MTIIDAGTRATFVDSNNTSWIYYLDADTPSVFYVEPLPQLAIQNGQPAFHLTVYQDGGGAFVTATLSLTTALGPAPSEVVDGIVERLATPGVQPTAQAMPYIDVGDGPERNQAYLNLASADGTVSLTANVVPSLSSPETAAFSLTGLSAREVDFLQRYFGGDSTAGTVGVTYELTVMAKMNGVTAHVHFSASAAYEFQRTFAWVH